MTRLWVGLVIACLASMGVVACDEEAKKAEDDTNVTQEDSTTTADADVEQDTGPVETCLGTLPAQVPGERVHIDLCPYLGDLEATGASAAEVTDAAQLITGPAAQSRLGDYRLNTGTAGFIVQGLDRHATPCPYGGTLIDATYLGPDGQGEPTPDHFGEACLLLQLGRTLRPEDESAFEIVRDGSEGGGAVLAVTGPDRLNDWISLQGVVSTFIQGVISLPLNPEISMGTTITNYYIAPPDENFVHYVSALRNDSEETVYVLAGDLMDSGGLVSFYNPTSTLGGFGYNSASPEAMRMLGFIGEDASQAYIATKVDAEGNFPVNNSYLAISGVAGIALGMPSLASLFIATPDSFKNLRGVRAIEPGGVEVWSRRVAVGSGDFSVVTDALYGESSLSSELSGRVVDEAGTPVPDVRVSFIRSVQNQSVTVARTDADGRFSAILPADTYRVQADPPDRVVTAIPEVTLAAGTPATTEIVVGAPGKLSVNIAHGLDQSPLPAKVTVLCDGACPRAFGSQLRDISFDGLGANVADVFFVPPTGTLERPLVPGDYRVVVSRGMSWSTWPLVTAGQSPQSSASPITITAGETTSVNAELFPAVDTAEYVSADFHVHSINSPDAPIANDQRVLSFMAEGVDVLISTDHDFVTDFTPNVQNVGGEDFLATVVGVELTTFDYGHFNSFPLQRDPADLTGGAPDWSVDEGPPLHPETIFSTLQGYEGEQVVQLNHPVGALGYLSSIGFDASQGTSTSDPTVFRMDPVTPDPITGDTGLYSEDFTAIEVMNGFSVDRFWTVGNWWFTMLSRGFTPTATAVSDTHRVFTDVAGGPRSFIRVGAAADTIATFDEARLAEATNAGELFGTNGPFIHVTAENEAGDVVSLGGTLDQGGAGKTITLHVDIQTPSWMTVNDVRVYSNIIDGDIGAGEPNNAVPIPVATAAVNLTDAELVGPVGTEPGDTTQPSVAYKTTTSLTVTPDADAYYIVVVRGSNAESMFPVVWSDTKPFAFTNPIFVDTNGGGYDTFPLAGGSGGGMPQPAVIQPTQANTTPRPLTLEEAYQLFEILGGHAGHDD